MSDRKTKNWKKFKEEYNSQEEELAEEQALDEEALDEMTTTEMLEETDSLSKKELQEALILAKLEVQEAKDKAVRALAEVTNIRHRAKLDIEKNQRFGLTEIINSLLPVIDSLENALQAAANHEASGMEEGLELTLKLFLDVLKKYHVEQIDPIGEVFNPEKHEAMAMIDAEDAPANTIVSVFQKGYTLHDRVIRPARVIIAKPKQS